MILEDSNLCGYFCGEKNEHIFFCKKRIGLQGKKERGRQDKQHRLGRGLLAKNDEGGVS